MRMSKSQRLRLQGIKLKNLAKLANDTILLKALSEHNVISVYDLIQAGAEKTRQWPRIGPARMEKLAAVIKEHLPEHEK